MSDFGGDMVERPGNGQAVAALVLGLIAVPLMCFWYIAFPCAILAIVFGALGRSKAKQQGATGKGMATAGLALGIIGVLLPILVIAGALALFGIAASNPELQSTIQESLREAMENAQDGAASPPDGP